MPDNRDKGQENLDLEAVEEKVAPQTLFESGILQERFIIKFSQSIPEFSSPHVKAFVASDKRKKSENFYALICDRYMPARTNVMRILKGIRIPGLVQLVEWGPIYYPQEESECLVAIFEHPPGMRIMNSLNDRIPPLTEDNIIPLAIEPLVATLKELAFQGITHRAIRPTNMFYGKGETTLLGDGVTSPVAYDQPLLFETIESGMTDPIARGIGTYADDVYALGVSLIIRHLGFNPVAWMDDETLLKHKMQVGSYAALVGEERVHSSLIELLRSMLCDDPEQRWTIDDVEMWLTGRRMSPIQTRVEKRATRGFLFEDHEYFHAQSLAYAMGNNWGAAINTVMEDKLGIWLERALEEKTMASNINSIIQNRGVESSRNLFVFDVMMSKILILLSPSSPLRYKGVSVMLDGLGAYLAKLMKEKSNVNLITEVILYDIPSTWVDVRHLNSIDSSRMSSNSQVLKSYINQTGLGFGLERCLYDMNETISCQSPLLDKHYVADIKQLLPALNAIADQHRENGQWPIDHHIAAFMGARFPTDIDHSLMVLNDKKTSISFMALMNILATLQHRTGQNNLPKLTSWLIKLAVPLLERYHSRKKREEIKKELQKIGKKSSIVDIYNILENPESLRQDISDFLWAQAQYQAAEEEIRELDDNVEERAEESELIGRQTATMVSIIIAFFILLIVVITTFW